MKRTVFASDSQTPTALELKNRRIAYRAALEGIVLLENDGTLPLKESGKVALYGSGAAYTVKGGTGSGEVNERHSISVLEGFESAGFTVSSGSWLSDYEATRAEAYEHWKKAPHKGLGSPFMPPEGREITADDIAESDTDTAFYLISRQAGEGADKKLERNEYDLTPGEIRNLRTLTAGYAHTVLVINAGSPLNLSILDEAPPSAVIFLCQAGMEGGRALADLVLGKACPSGRLSDSWARSYEDIPFGSEYSYLSGDTTREDYLEGIYVGYRYFDSFGVAPRYPFGHGLSYTSFEMTPTKLSQEGRFLLLDVSVRNTGSCPGSEVVQLYAAAPQGRLHKEAKRLIAFAKTRELVPGHTERLTLSFDAADCASYDEAASAYLLEEGLYRLLLGHDSRNVCCAGGFLVNESLITSQHKALLKPAAPVSALTAPSREMPADDVPFVLALDPAPFPTKAFRYPEKDPRQKEISALMQDLSRDAKIRLCVGEGILGMFRTRGNYTPGAVGRSTGALTRKNIPNVNLCDGPAGLRILRESGLGPGGGLKFCPGSPLISMMEALPPVLLKPFTAKPGRDRMLYQYATAFPVGTCLAQSWNRRLMEEVGAAVSAEMSAYGVSFWLAPAMNLHRNPLCGRNFEYLSEDPLLTGLMAASIVNGVQSIPGNYATVKHFACNNQEDNRMHSDSRVDERPLRELYLKSFELALRESAPAALMSSYNLLNGTYTPNSRELLTDILRSEFGFDGVVMTDWFATSPGCGRHDLALAAGNDWIMPGGRGARKSLRKSLRKGILSDEALDLAAYHVFRSVMNSKVKQEERE